jgi:hypothetical protein
MGTGGNFEDKLWLFKNPDGTISVDASGPVYDGTLREISVFVSQPEKAGPNDAVAAQSTLAPGSGHLDLSKPGKWAMRANPRTAARLAEGKAFAMAIAVFMTLQKEEKVRLWAQSVELDWPHAAPASQPQTSSTDPDGT